VTVLLVAREGMEAALLMSTLLFQLKALDVIAGAVLGLAGAAGMPGSGRASGTG